MDIAASRTFLEIVKNGSFVAAALKLGITQTAVSARVRVIEEQLGCKVFVRSNSGAKLTSAGKQFLPFARDLVFTWERAQEAIQSHSVERKEVSLGAEISIPTTFLRHWVQWMRRECPECAVTVWTDSSGCLIDKVQSGDIDVAVVYAAPSLPGIVTELLFEEKLVMVETTFEGNQSPGREGVRVNWGQNFSQSYEAAFPEHAPPKVTITHGPLALEYILAVGGSGYFREGYVSPLLAQGQLSVVHDSPEFSYAAYLVHSAICDEDTITRVRTGLRASTSIAIY